MHIYVLTRGIKRFQDKFFSDLAGNYLPRHTKDKKGNFTPLKNEAGEIVHQEIHVNPIQLHEIIFPEEHYDLMANTLFGDSFEQGKSQHPVKHALPILAIRKALGVKKMKPWKKDRKLLTSRQHMELIAIGMKEDGFQTLEDGKEDKIERL